MRTIIPVHVVERHVRRPAADVLRALLQRQKRPVALVDEALDRVLLDVAHHRIGPSIAIEIADHQRPRRLVADDVQGIADPRRERPVAFADQHVQRVHGVGKDDIRPPIAVEVPVQAFFQTVGGALIKATLRRASGLD